jgi:hypothetical protein
MPRQGQRFRGRVPQRFSGVSWARPWWGQGLRGLRQRPPWWAQQDLSEPEEGEMPRRGKGYRGPDPRRFQRMGPGRPWWGQHDLSKLQEAEEERRRQGRGYWSPAPQRFRGVGRDQPWQGHGFRRMGWGRPWWGQGFRGMAWGRLWWEQQGFAEPMEEFLEGDENTLPSEEESMTALKPRRRW